MLEYARTLSFFAFSCARAETSTSEGLMRTSLLFLSLVAIATWVPVRPAHALPEEAASTHEESDPLARYLAESAAAWMDFPDCNAKPKACADYETGERESLG